MPTLRELSISWRELTHKLIVDEQKIVRWIVTDHAEVWILLEGLDYLFDYQRKAHFALKQLFLDLLLRAWLL